MMLSQLKCWQEALRRHKLDETGSMMLDPQEAVHMSLNIPGVAGTYKLTAVLYQTPNHYEGDFLHEENGTWWHYDDLGVGLERGTTVIQIGREPLFVREDNRYKNAATNFYYERIA